MVIISNRSDIVIDHLKLCQCGAVTVIFKSGDSIAMSYGSMVAMYPDIKFPLLDDLKKSLVEMYYNCNHCVNGWGEDLCECGCKAPKGECYDK
jgi:hypothetical protein